MKNKLILGTTLLLLVNYFTTPLYCDLQTSMITAPEAPATFDIGKVFASCPIIYSILLLLSSAATGIWIYSLFTLKLSEMMPEEFTALLRRYLAKKEFDEALEYCKSEKNFASSIMVGGLAARNHGTQIVMNVVRSEGRRAGNIVWQRIALLNDIAVIAPMLGLLGTVLGLFFAFYDTSNTTENISSIFDGLGIAIGTTVLGLIVAILSMIYYTSLKYRVVNLLNSIESESLELVSLIEPDHSQNNHTTR